MRARRFQRTACDGHAEVVGSPIRRTNEPAYFAPAGQAAILERWAAWAGIWIGAKLPVLYGQLPSGLSEIPVGVFRPTRGLWNCSHASEPGGGLGYARFQYPHPHQMRDELPVQPRSLLHD